ncbi:MAG TPA: phage baseplate assembly protein V [Rhodoblastus sp.]|nr:phage baseplate assembly protein V [Rhodoblastus sp.]
MTKFFGKYRGTVVSNGDPELRGRLMVQAPAALGSSQVWALPCAPYGGKGVGFFTMPPIGANIWVEFEGGNPENPIWSGCFWALGEFPAAMAIPLQKVFKTDAVTITITDAPGVGLITIETALGMKIAISATGIEINDGMQAVIKLEGPKVSINGPALEVI